MKIEEFKKNEMIKDKEFYQTTFSDLEKGKRKRTNKQLDFQGVYVLVNDNEEVVYIGSAYVRPIRERLLQYLGNSKTGNTLRKDLIDAGVTTEANVISYINGLKIYAFKDESLEYKLIKVAGLELINKTGKESPTS